MNINNEDMESAHVLPSRSEYGENINPSLVTPNHPRRHLNQSMCPAAVIVWFPAETKCSKQCSSEKASVEIDYIILNTEMTCYSYCCLEAGYWNLS